MKIIISILGKFIIIFYLNGKKKLMIINLIVIDFRKNIRRKSNKLH